MGGFRLQASHGGMTMNDLHPWKELVGASVRPFCHIEVNAHNSALLVIDMQNYICRPDMGLGEKVRSFPEVADYYFPRLERLVIPHISKLVTFFRRNRLPVVYLRVGPLFQDCRDLFPLRRNPDAFPQYPVGTYAHEIIDELKPLQTDVVLDKNSAGAFNSTAIDQLLRNMGVTSLVITGVATNSCVNLTASDAADRGYSCVLVNDACATFGQIVHDVTMATFARIFGLVWDTGEVLQYFSRALNR